MFQVVKILMLIWLIVCMMIGGCSVLLGGAAATAEASTIEEVMAENPELDRKEAQQLIDLTGAGAAVGGTMVAGFGLFGAFALWAAGMVPLLVMYLVFKPAAKTTIQVQQVVGGDMPASQRLPNDRES